MFFFYTLKIECQCKEIIDAKKKIKKRKPHKDEERKDYLSKFGKYSTHLRSCCAIFHYITNLKCITKKFPILYDLDSRTHFVL
jgi:hypothetical protein